MASVNGAISRLHVRMSSSELTMLDDAISSKISRIVIFFLSFSYSMVSVNGAISRLHGRTDSSESTMLEDAVSTKIPRIFIFFLSFSYSLTSVNGAISRLRGRTGSSEPMMLEDAMSSIISRIVIFFLSFSYSMASDDGAQSLHVGSDAVYTYTCEPCDYRGVNREAVTFCRNCNEYMCHLCTESHKGQKISRNHELLDVKDMSSMQTSTVSDSLILSCDCDQTSPITHYCIEHEQACCANCKILKHRKCQSITIGEKIKSFSENQLKEVIQRVATLKKEMDSFIRNRTTDLKHVQTMTAQCKSDIHTYRKELNSYLDILEDKVVKESKVHEAKFKQEISRHIETCSSTLKSLTADKTLLVEAQTTSKKANMFAAHHKVSHRIENYESLLNDFKQESVSPDLTFKSNEELRNLLKTVKELGKLTGQIKHKSSQNTNTLFTELAVDSSRKVNIQLSSDSTGPWISGCTFIPDGGVVLCDHENSNLILLSDEFTVTERLHLDYRPWDVSPVNSNNVMVTIPNKKKLLLIQVVPSLKRGRSINVDRECWGVQVVDDLIYVTCHNSPGEGEVLVVDMNGTVTHRLGQPDKKSSMFFRPNYITVCPATRKMFITDEDTHTVSCMMSNRTVVYQYKDEKLRGLAGVCVDGGGNVIVCGYFSHNVQVIRADGTKLTSQDGVPMPHSVAYRQSDNNLILGCLCNNNILVYKMK